MKHGIETRNIFIKTIPNGYYLSFQSMGLAIGATVMSFNRGIVVAAVSMLTCMLLGGFYTRRVPFWLKWVRYISFLTYSYENCLIMEFTGSEDHRSEFMTLYLREDIF